MHARFPKISYSDVRPHWAPNQVFAHNVNSSSTIPVFVEPWLIKVMAKAKEALPLEETQLHHEIDVFIAQEAQHYRQHAGFNRRIREAYPEIVPYEKQIEREYDDMLVSRSLKYNLAYSEGFESMGPPNALMWFESFEEAGFLDGADYESVALWKWHMAEEYEHREVCYRLFRALYARTLWGRFWNGWLYRCYGFVCALRHLGAYSQNVSRTLIATDRRKMTPDQLEKSKADAAVYGELMKNKFMPELKKVFSPFYNPAKKREPRGMRAYLDRFDKGGDMGRKQAA